MEKEENYNPLTRKLLVNRSRHTDKLVIDIVIYMLYQSALATITK